MTALIEIADAVADRDGWLEARKGYLCGSEAAAVIGSSQWPDRSSGKPVVMTAAEQRSAAALKKAGLATFEETERMWWGRVMQDTIVENLGDSPGECKGLRATTLEKLIRDPECEHVAATPDCWIEHPEHGRIVGEIKFVSYHWRVKKADPPGTLPPPIDYQIQCQVAMACTGSERCALIEQHSNMSYLHMFERHERVIDRIRHAAPIFLAEVARLKGEANDRPSNSAA